MEIENTTDASIRLEYLYFRSSYQNLNIYHSGGFDQQIHEDDKKYVSDTDIETELQVDNEFILTRVVTGSLVDKNDNVMDHSGQPGNYYVEKSDSGHSSTNNWTKSLLVVVPGPNGASLEPGGRTSFGLFGPDSPNNTVIQFYAKTDTSSDNNVLYVHDLDTNDEPTGDVVPLQEFYVNLIGDQPEPEPEPESDYFNESNASFGIRFKNGNLQIRRNDLITGTNPIYLYKISGIKLANSNKNIGTLLNSLVAANYVDELETDNEIHYQPTISEESESVNLFEITNIWQNITDGGDNEHLYLSDPHPFGKNGREVGEPVTVGYVTENSITADILYTAYTDWVLEDVSGTTYETLLQNANPNHKYDVWVDSGFAPSESAYSIAALNSFKSVVKSGVSNSQMINLGYNSNSISEFTNDKYNFTYFIQNVSVETWSGHTPGQGGDALLFLQWYNSSSNEQSNYSPYNEAENRRPRQVNYGNVQGTYSFTIFSKDISVTQWIWGYVDYNSIPFVSYSPDFVPFYNVYRSTRFRRSYPIVHILNIICIQNQS